MTDSKRGISIQNALYTTLGYKLSYHTINAQLCFKFGLYEGENSNSIPNIAICLYYSKIPDNIFSNIPLNLGGVFLQ
ncbi:hypothetical protein FACS189432_08140 [Bacteroidia bacterium]|nr:hypothetical protein FACS189426_20760 [Bacteroidia bacterium]GHT29190.1 hypothetical protein FACS189432_08140 [Bacteroidia bacterium]GHV70307.1 hypothetical protein FACS189420_0850 [Bacteroidia bacterium]